MADAEKRDGDETQDCEKRAPAEAHLLSPPRTQSTRRSAHRVSAPRGYSSDSAAQEIAEEWQVLGSDPSNGSSNEFLTTPDQVVGSEESQDARRRRFSEVARPRPYPREAVDRDREREQAPPPSTSRGPAEIGEGWHMRGSEPSNGSSDDFIATPDQVINTEERQDASRRRFSEVARPRPYQREAVDRDREREQASPPSTSGSGGQAQVRGIVPPLPRWRNRWDQPPCCSEGEARLMMTCCQARLCRDCAIVNPCGCPHWQEGRGFAVPMFPHCAIPDDCVLERPFTLDYPAWLRIHASRDGDRVRFVYMSLEDIIHRPAASLISQVHCYETIGSSWSRFHCDIYQWDERICMFSYPPFSRQDELDFERVVNIWRQRRRR